MDITDLKNIGQSYLFVGPKGCGKSKKAMQLASKFASQFDIKIYTPNGARGYLADQVKEIISDSQLRPLQGKHKFFIIKKADVLGNFAANALLKTLEEPTESSHFILLTNSVDMVLPTIVSRCQVVKFKALPQSEVIQTVMNECNVDETKAKYAVKLFDNDIEGSIEFLNDENLQDFNDEIIYILQNQFNEWEILEKSRDIVSKVKEICNTLKDKLDDEAKDMKDVLDIKELEKQNKRLVSAKQTELLYMMCNVIKIYFKEQLDQNPKYIETLNSIREYEAKLSYNISPQIFCDCVLLNMKEE